MSRFFRSGSSSSSDSDSEVDSSPDSNPDEPVSGSLHIGETSPTSDASALAIDRSAPTLEGSARDFLLHALLEERCMSQARASPTARRYGPESPEVRAVANARYLQLCSQLSPLNLVSSGLEHDQHASTRQRFRDGLELLNHGDPAKTAVYSQPLQKLLTDVDTEVWTNQAQQPSPAPGLPGHAGDLQLFGGSGLVPTYAHRPQGVAPAARSLVDPRSGFVTESIFESRYHRDFEQLSLLGQGGFGVVYHVRHRLDKQAYAVKKVPLSRSKIYKIQQRGQSELDEFLLELQTLARLEHPNIVRYYGGWIEWVENQSSSLVVSSNEGVTSDNTSKSLLGLAGHWQPSLSRVVTESRSQDVDVLFENSGPIPQNSTSARSEELSEAGSLHLQRVATKSTTATASDDVVETIERSEAVEPSVSVLSAADGADFAGPTLALHVQMSLHPMTLADFISPPSTSRTLSAEALSHCFHADPAINILLAILDGVEYLHHEGVVHRDIKPANIFLGASPNSHRTRGSVDLARCPECDRQGQTTPIALQVRIGDFGLVTALAQDSMAAVGSSAIGTEIYRPLTATSNASPSLDVYALGIIAFELLYKFDTRMERHETIQQLKGGHFPRTFATRLGSPRAAAAEECITAMLRCENEEMTTRELRTKLFAIQK